MTTPAPRDTGRCINCSSPTCGGEACMESPYQPRDTGPALDPRAVEAAAEALHTDWCREPQPCRSMTSPADHRRARLALTAAAPFLRAEGAAAERQRIAAAIRAACEADDPPCRHEDCEAERDIYRDAARIAEADPGTSAAAETARERDAARQALADLIGELRGLCDGVEAVDPLRLTTTRRIRRVIDPYDPDLFQCVHCERYRDVEERHGGRDTDPGYYCDACVAGP